jgi:error-prone DNA polymerase
MTDSKTTFNRIAIRRNSLSSPNLRRAEILRILSTVREFMFPESHAQSFASLAYSSGYIRFHYRAAYLCAMLNNQPMGFYSPSTLISDAKLHGLKFRPIDVQHSAWNCTLEALDEKGRSRYSDSFAVRIGLRYVKGMRQEIPLSISLTLLISFVRLVRGNACRVDSR